MRSYIYSGVPEPSDIQMAKSFVAHKKAHKDKVQREKNAGGSPTFKRRHKYANKYLFEQLQKGVKVRDGNMNPTSFNSTMLS